MLFLLPLSFTPCLFLSQVSVILGGCDPTPRFLFLTLRVYFWCRFVFQASVLFSDSDSRVILNTSYRTDDKAASVWIHIQHILNTYQQLLINQAFESTCIWAKYRLCPRRLDHLSNILGLVEVGRRSLSQFSYSYWWASVVTPMGPR